MPEPALFLDAYTRIGPRHRKHIAHGWRLEHLLAEMEHCSISGALVASTTSASYEAMFSNLELSARISPHSHLWAAWNALPGTTGDFPPAEEFCEEMRKHGARAATIFPRANYWDLLAEDSRPLLDELERRSVLTIIDRAELHQGGDNDVAGYRELAALLEAHPRLPLLLTGAHWLHQRFLLPLIARHRNLHVTFDTLQGHRLVEDLVERGCADQLVFGSNAPLMSMGAHRCFIDYAEIPDAVRAKIAGGNLARLLKLEKVPRERVNRDEDPIMAAARRGEPLPAPVIDMHMHILHEGMHSGGALRMRDGGPSGVFRQLRRLGVEGGGFMSWNGVVASDSLAGNDTVRLTLDAAPRGYWGLATIDPAHYTRQEMLDLVPKMHADPRFIGMKPYYLHGVEYHHRSWDPWWRFGNANRFYALLHRGRKDFAEIDALAERYPRVRWVVAHCGADFATADLAIESMRRHRNVYAEITLTPVAMGVIDYLVEHAGAERVLYGTDLPMRDPRQQLGWVVFSRLGLAAKRRVLGGNALEVIAPCLRRLPEANRPPVAPRPVARARRKR